MATSQGSEPVQGQPAPQREASAGLIVVSTRGDGRVLLLDPDTGATVATIEAGIGLHEIACAPDASLAVGSAYGSGPQHSVPDRRLCVVDLARVGAAQPGMPSLSSTIDLVTEAGVEHPRPNDLAIRPDGRRALVTSEVRDALLEVDLVERRIVREIPHGVAAGHMLAVTPDWKRAFVPGVRDGTVAVIDLDAGTVVARIPTAVGAEGIACSPDGRHVWVACNRAGSITAIDAVGLTPIETFSCEGFPFRVRFTPDGRSVLVSCPQAGVVRVYDVASRTQRGAIATEAMPTSLAVEPGGTRACVVAAATGTVQILDLVGLKVERTIPAGPQADGLAWSAARATAAAK